MTKVGNGSTGKVPILLLGILIGLVALSPASAVITQGKVRKTAKKQATKVVNAEAIVKPVAYRRSALTPLLIGNVETAVALCPEGFVAVGGGESHTTDSGPGVFQHLSAPSVADGSGPGTAGWTVVLGNDSANDTTFRAYVVCVKSDLTDAVFQARGDGWDTPTQGKGYSGS